jgi:hypothetical protein
MQYFIYGVIVTVSAVAVGVGNYYVYQAVGCWAYIAISLACGVVWAMMTRYNLRKRRLSVSQHAHRDEGVVTDIRKKGF